MTAFDRDLKLAIWQRDNGQCFRCGHAVWQGDVHHRKARGMGGSKDPRLNSPANLLLLCRGCHDWVETHRAPARVFGWLLRDVADAEATPALGHDGVWYVLDSRLFRTPTAPPVAVPV